MRQTSISNRLKRFTNTSASPQQKFNDFLQHCPKVVDAIDADEVIEARKNWARLLEHQCDESNLKMNLQGLENVELLRDRRARLQVKNPTKNGNSLQMRGAP